MYTVMILLLIMLMTSLPKYYCTMSLIDLGFYPCLCHIFLFSLTVNFQYLKIEIYGI